MKGEYAASAAGKRQKSPADVNGTQTAADFSSVGHCDEHYDTEAVGDCRDCRRPNL